MEEIVEELPEDADLSMDPGHSEQLLSERTCTPVPKHPSPSPSPSATPTPGQASVGPEAVMLQNSDLGPEAITMESGKGNAVSSPETAATVAATTAVPESGNNSDQESSKAETGGSMGGKHGDELSLASEVSGVGEEKTAAKKEEQHKYATLSRVRKFKVDGQTIETTTRKIVDVTANKTLRDNRKQKELR